MASTKGFVERENEKEAKKTVSEKLADKLNQNVIDTGTSVQTLNKVLKPATQSQVFVSFLTLIIALLAAWIAWLSYKANTSIDVKERLKSTEESIRKIERYIDKIPQSTMKDTVYMIMIPKKK